MPRWISSFDGNSGICAGTTEPPAWPIPIFKDQKTRADEERAAANEERARSNAAEARLQELESELAQRNQHG